MPNPYAQVTLTYFRRPFSSVRRSFLILGILIYLVIVFCGSGLSENYHEFLLPTHLLLFTVLFAYCAIHLKEQFADSRASLIPGFRTVHGVVAIIMAIVFDVLLPGAIAPLIGWQSLGFISITALLFGAILWLILLQSTALSLLIPVGYVSIFAEPIRGGLEQIVLGHNPVQAFALFGIGVALNIAGIVRLFRLNEEMPEYHSNIPVYRGGRIQISDRQWRMFEKSYSRGWRGRVAERRIANLIYHAQHASDSNWSRVRRWEVLNLTSWSACLITIGFYLGFLLMNWFIDKEMQTTIMYSMATIFSASIYLGLLWNKITFLSHELMMPVRRDAYLKQLGINAAVIQLVIWGASIASIILVMFTSTRELHPELLAYAITLSALAQIWIFGLAVWLFHFRSIVLIVVVFSIALILTSAPLAVLTSPLTPTQWRPLLLLVGGLFACFGLLLTWRSYRRWMITDFN